MNAVTLRGICVTSVLFALVLCLLPEGREKQIASLCATAALVLMLLGLVRQNDWGDYALSLSEARAAADAVSLDADAKSKALNRFVIEQKCEEYIWDKAADLSLPLKDVEIHVQWRDEGVWTPESVRITATEYSQKLERLSGLIEAQLGIPLSRQELEIENDSG